MAPLLVDCLCADMEQAAARNDVVEQRLDPLVLSATPEQIAGAAREHLPSFRASDGRLVPDGDGGLRLVARSDDGPSRSEDILTIAPAGAGQRVRITSQSWELEPRTWQVARVEPAPDLEAVIADRMRAERELVEGTGLSPEIDLRMLLASVCEQDHLPVEWEPPAPVVETTFVAETAAPERVRRRFQMSPDGRGGTRVSVFRIHERAASPPAWRPRSGGRQLALELDLVEALDPQRGRAIRAESDTAGARAYQGARDSGAFGCSDFLP